MLCFDDPLVAKAIMVWGDGITAVAYYYITYQLLAFVVHSKMMKMTDVLRNNKEKSKRSLFYMLLAVAGLFASFITLCGNTHTLNVLRNFYPASQALRVLDLGMMILCAVVSVCTGIIVTKLFPVILTSLNDFELNSEGGLQHIENYLIEVVEMVKEGVLVLSENMVILRCNEASKTLLNTPNLLNKSYTDFIHPNDMQTFQSAVVRVLGSYNMTPVTIEYRVNRNAFPVTPLPEVNRKTTPPNSFHAQLFNKTAARVYVAPPSIPEHEVELIQSAGLCPPLAVHVPTLSCGSHSSLPHRIGARTSSIELDLLSCLSPDVSTDTLNGQVVENDVIAEKDQDYIWVEATICKGMSLNQNDDFEYDLKLVCRDIEDRKREALREYNDLVRENEERERINSAKLRYISCIAHDLKTPLQSFCFTLDLLNQTNMHPEQREFVQQANVAVDLMRLTISQTMDISKALTGAKLMPRRTTVHLSSIMSRVEIIINGYGKQVPVTFKLARNVCDSIITDEEWLWQMILNLLTNACKYTDRGEITVTVSKTQGSPALNQTFHPEMLLVEVADTGVGVSDDKIGGMFDAFAQVQDGQVTGTGLGLFGVRTRAEGLLGTCGARHNTESSTGTGTVLWFAIPYISDESSNAFADLSFSDEAFIESGVMPAFSLNISGRKSLVFDTLTLPSSYSPDHAVSEGGDQAAEDDLGNVEEQHSSIAPTDLAARTEWLIRSRKLTALVIDDTKTVCKLMERLLMKMGFDSVKCYENGSKGLEAMMAAPVDIVFSDVQMPIMTGPEMARRFRLFENEALASGVRSTRQLIVAVTANGSELSDGGTSNGFDQVCPKPLSAKDIYQLVLQHCK